MNVKDIETFEKNQLRLAGTYHEVKALSNKRPDDAINLFKLQLINQMLVEANTILKEKSIPFKDFRKFNEIDLPTNSDVVFVLSGYLSAFEKVRLENITEESYGEWYWKANGEVTDIRTAPPQNLK
jgi:hypothetical protein